MPVYIYILYAIQHILYISRSGHCEVLKEILVFKVWQKDKGRIIRHVRGCNIFQGFARVNGQFFETILQTYSDVCIFCSAIQYIVSKKQPVGSAHEVSADSSEIVFDEAHFIVNLQSFLQRLALLRRTLSQSESFVPHSPRQNNFQNASPLGTSETALMCTFSSILSHSQANQKNSIIKA